MCRGFRFLLPLLLVLANQSAVFAWVQPSFGGHACTWDATHIVVVTEGEKIDGVVEVLESWKGDLKKGDVITVPQLAAFAPKEKRLIAEKLFQDERPGRLTHVTCSRIVLFLIKEEETDGAGALKVKWLPANLYWKKMDVSMLWVEQKQVYGFWQQENPGPSELIPFGKTEGKLHEDVANLVKIQVALRSATRPFDQAKAEYAMKLLVHCPSQYVKDAGVTEVGLCGKVAGPLLKNLLQNPDWAASRPVIFTALAEAGCRVD